MCLVVFCFFFKQKTAYEMRISDWSSDVCSSDLLEMKGYGPPVDESEFYRLTAFGADCHSGIAPVECVRIAIKPTLRWSFWCRVRTVFRGARCRFCSGGRCRCVRGPRRCDHARGGVFRASSPDRRARRWYWGHAPRGRGGCLLRSEIGRAHV